MQTTHTQTHHLDAQRVAMWFAPTTVCTGSVAVAPLNKVRPAIRPAGAGGPAGGVS